MYYYGGYQGYGNGCCGGCGNVGYGYGGGYGAAIILVLFILLVIIIGAGGHAKVIADIIDKSNDNIVGFIDDKEELQGKIILLKKHCQFNLLQVRMEHGDGAKKKLITILHC